MSEQIFIYVHTYMAWQGQWLIKKSHKYIYDFIKYMLSVTPLEKAMILLSHNLHNSNSNAVILRQIFTETNVI